MPKKTARTKALEDLERELLEVLPVSTRSKKVKTKPDKVSPVLEAKKPKPKPKAKQPKSDKVEKPLEIYELAALYEFFHRDTVTSSYRTWPDITIAEAREIVKQVKADEINSWPQVADMYHNDPKKDSVSEDERKKYKIVKYGYDDLREFRNAVIEKEIFIGMSIPLFIEHFKIEEDDPVMLTLCYAWSAYVKIMIERRRKQGNEKSRHAATVQEGDFCVEIECNAEQAIILERYCAAFHGTLLACRDYLKSLGNRAPKRIDKISSKLATQIRADQNFSDVPRSLIVSALNGYTQKLKFDNDLSFKRDLGRFYVKDSFKLHENSLTVGKAKDIAIRKVIGGVRHDLTIRGISFVRISPLVYGVTVQYDKMEFLDVKFGTD
ncbi:hypothetical protein HOU08_gp201 [Dickeya phage vB_DsoM_JA29]|uniref:Uncharacterized protein n=1 Tax=Dickeya phage vB_DsoM_JA29 TaxID=2283031 RepID=A0A384ZXH2_9CAUD|nr:hypothetical protein HOU08_gp201 [Dickeya phage vB_DsoM_JA29]AXG66927.1 hypothetical protein JA29_201 [Dickeya phage vB_DsoM_JA29]